MKRPAVHLLKLEKKDLCTTTTAVPVSRIRWQHILAPWAEQFLGYLAEEPLAAEKLPLPQVLGPALMQTIEMRIEIEKAPAHERHLCCRNAHRRKKSARSQRASAVFCALES